MGAAKHRTEREQMHTVLCTPAMNSTDPWVMPSLHACIPLFVCVHGLCGCSIYLIEVKIHFDSLGVSVVDHLLHGWKLHHNTHYEESGHMEYMYSRHG